jgi:hypothetical protein
MPARRHPARPVAVWLFVAAGAIPAHAQWNATLLPTPPFEGSTGRAGDALQVAGQILGIQNRAALWDNGVMVDIHPAGATSSVVAGTHAGVQTGWVLIFGGGPGYRAALWSGTAASFVNLHPQGSNESYALGLHGGRQVGVAEYNELRHATVWSGTAASAVDLHPPGAHESVALGISGDQIVGMYIPEPGAQPRACLWQGAAGTFLDMAPPGSLWSQIERSYGAQQVGGCQWGSHRQATLWSGTPASAVALGAPGVTSHAFAANEGIQVGYSGAAPRAVYWSGTAASIRRFPLPAPPSGTTWSDSAALAIWSHGTALYSAGFGQYGSGNTSRAILWSRPLCYANCDYSTAAPQLNVADFTCFLQKFAAGESYANCDGSTTAPTLNVADFTCFLQQFAAGCP